MPRLDNFYFHIKLSSMNINSSQIDSRAREICNILQSAGFQAYIVGGCVRDLLLNTLPKDWDICTDASPAEVMMIFPKTYPTGLQHGTVTVSMGDRKEFHYEVTTFRTDGTYTDGRRPDSIIFVKSLEEDLLRRDFTINAMAYDPVNNKLIDPFNGIRDLQNKVIRAVGHAVNRFTEDGLRIMRAARFAARLDYTIEHTTLTGMAVCSYMLENISKERIREELCKILMTAKPSVGLQLLWDVEAFEYILARLNKNSTEMKNDFEAIDRCNSVHYETKLAILVFDYSDLKVTENILREMTFSNEEINNTLFILNSLNVMESLYLDWFMAERLPSHVVRKGLAYIKNNCPYGYVEGLNEFMKFLQALTLDGVLSDLESNRNQNVWGRSDLLLSGKDLIEMGIPPGPQFKTLLDAAYEEIILNPENNKREHLINFVRSWINT